MSDEDALLAAVIANPADDVPRLVYADYLEEHGRPHRAAHIRAQCEAARHPMGSKRRLEADRQADELRRQHGEEITAPYPELRTRGLAWSFTRGFPSYLSANADQFVEFLPTLARKTPVTSMTLGPPKAPGGAGQFAALPELARLEYLACWDEFQAEDLRTVLASDHLTGLRDLRVGGFLDPRVTATLATRPGFRSLRRLALVYRGPATADFAAAVLLPVVQAPPALAGLELLDLRSFPLGPTGAERLAPAVKLPGLRRLRAENTRLGGPGVTALLSAPGLAGLTHLALLSPGVVPADPANWSAAPAGLESVFFNGNHLGEAGVRGLARATHLRRLTALALPSNGLSGDDVAALAGWPGLASVRQLDLQYNRCGDAGAAALAVSPHLEHVERLCVTNNNLRKAGREALKARFGRRCLLTRADAGIWSG